MGNMPRDSTTQRTTRVGLCALNFFSSDIRDGLAPFAAVFLLQEAGWRPGMIGIAMTANSISQFAVQTPVGAFIDGTVHKKAVCIACCVVVATMSLAMVYFPDFWAVVITRAIQGVGSAALPPAIAAMTLGVVGSAKFAHQISYNEVFNHAGMACCSLGAGLAAYFWEPKAAFFIVGSTGALSILCLPLITGIDHDVARGLAPADSGRDDGDGERSGESLPPATQSENEEGELKGGGKKAMGYGELLADRRILCFCLCCFGFHFGNAAMLPLLGQKLSLGDASGKNSMFYMAACQIVAQCVMTCIALIVGRLADSWGRLPVYMLGFAIIPTRGILVSLVHYSNSWLLISTQVFDGLANGIFGVLSVVVAEDLAAGTGHYNLVFGLVSTSVQVGAACSTLIGEFVVDIYDQCCDDGSNPGEAYNVAFRFLGCVALAPVLLFAVGVGETAPHLRPLPTGGEAEEEEHGHLAWARHSEAGPAALSCDRCIFGQKLEHALNSEETKPLLSQGGVLIS